MAKSELHRDYVLELENELQEFEMKAESTTRRMQMLVYPAMVAFFILSAFGFFLIYSLTSDVNRMANTIAHMSDSIDVNISSISGTMTHMSGTMDNLNNSTETMSDNVGKMNNTTVEMSDTISAMRPAINDMAASTNNMQRDFWSLNKNISTPLGFMNDFLPWKNSQSLPFQGSKAPLPPSYYSYPIQQQARDYNNPIPMPSYQMPAIAPDTNYSMPPVVPVENIKLDTQGSAVGSNIKSPVSDLSMR